MTAIQEEILGFEVLRDHLERALTEGHRYAEAESGLLTDSEVQFLFHRVAQFYKSFCGTVGRLEARAKHSPNRQFAALYEEVAAMARTTSEDGEWLLHWGLEADCKAGFEINFLELDYHLRARRNDVLAALEAFLTQALLPLLAAWRARLEAMPSLPSPQPTVTIAPAWPRRLPALRLA